MIALFTNKSIREATGLLYEQHNFLYCLRQYVYCSLLDGADCRCLKRGAYCVDSLLLNAEVENSNDILIYLWFL